MAKYWTVRGHEGFGASIGLNLVQANSPKDSEINNKISADKPIFLTKINQDFYSKLNEVY